MNAGERSDKNRGDRHFVVLTQLGAHREPATHGERDV